jgi:hypothetical protein
MKSSSLAIGVFCVFFGTIAPTAQITVSPQVRTKRTADGRVSVIEIGVHFVSAIRLPESVNSIAVGDPALFQVEHSEREPELVLVKALTERTSETNLLVSTIHGRQFSFLLVSRGTEVTSPKVAFSSGWTSCFNREVCGTKPCYGKHRCRRLGQAFANHVERDCEGRQQPSRRYEPQATHVARRLAPAPAEGSFTGALR